MKLLERLNSQLSSFLDIDQLKAGLLRLDLCFDVGEVL
jgi:hypothetical protein